LAKVKERLQERGLELRLSDEAKKWLIRKGSNTDFGARPLRRALENCVEDPLSEELLKGEFQGMTAVVVDVREVAGKKQLVFKGVKGDGDVELVGVAATDDSPPKTANG